MKDGQRIPKAEGNKEKLPDSFLITTTPKGKSVRTPVYRDEHGQLKFPVQTPRRSTLGIKSRTASEHNGKKVGPTSEGPKVLQKRPHSEEPEKESVHTIGRAAKEARYSKPDQNLDWLKEQVARNHIGIVGLHRLCTAAVTLLLEMTSRYGFDNLGSEPISTFLDRIDQIHNVVPKYYPQNNHHSGIEHCGGDGGAPARALNMLLKSGYQPLSTAKDLPADLKSKAADYKGPTSCSSFLGISQEILAGIVVDQSPWNPNLPDETVHEETAKSNSETGDRPCKLSRCQLPGCDAEVHKDDNGRIHNFCSKAHARQAGTIKPEKSLECLNTLDEMKDVVDAMDMSK